MKSVFVLAIFVVFAASVSAQITECGTPNCENSFVRNTLWPTLNAAQFYRCVEVAGVWTSTIVNCPCNTLFDFEDQECDPIAEWESFCRQYDNETPVPC